MTDHARAVEIARRQYLDRPAFSLKLRVFLSVIVPGVFVFAGMGLTAVLVHRALSPGAASVAADLRLAFLASSLTLLATPALAFLMAGLLYRRTVRPIRRFAEDAERIARGDHTPITPNRPYRDEFTELALALNRMILEMEKRQEESLAAGKLRSIGLLAAGIAHELNNPLQNLLLTAHGLMEEHATMPENERFELLRDLVKESERAQKIVSNLLDLVRQSRGETTPVPVADVLAQVRWLARSHLKLRRVKTTIEIESWLPPVTASRDELLQVLLNLVMNAADVTEPDGVVELEASRDRDRDFLLIRVTDHGPGIPEHILSHIFDPFFTTKPRGKGTGIGLAISRASVRKYGGSLTVETTSGAGTTFLVRLPTVPTPPDSPGVR